MAFVTPAGPPGHGGEGCRVSRMTVRILATACAVVFVAGVVGAATYDDADSTLSADGAASELDTVDGTTTTVDAGTTPATEPDGADDDATDDTTAGTTDAPAPTAPTTAAPTTAPPTTEPAPSIGTTPGTYTYDTTGTANGEDVSGTSTLEVPEVDGDGRQAQVMTAPDGKTTTVYRHAAEGTYLESLSVESEQGSFSLEATSPFLLIPADAATGTETKGRLQGEGLTADVTFTITDFGAETTTAELHVDLSGKIQGFDVDGTMDSTVVARTADQLPLDTRAQSDITVGNPPLGAEITSDTRSVLRR